jgi:hypothetical protein
MLVTCCIDKCDTMEHALPHNRTIVTFMYLLKSMKNHLFLVEHSVVHDFEQAVSVDTCPRPSTESATRQDQLPEAAYRSTKRFSNVLIGRLHVHMALYCLELKESRGMGKHTALGSKLNLPAANVWHKNSR